MNTRNGEIIHSGRVAPSPKRWRVVETHGHEDLQCGDEVVLVCTPNPDIENLLLRTTDMTLHRLQGNDEQYVHLQLVRSEQMTKP